jgi:diaminopimelate epimerase
MSFNFSKWTDLEMICTYRTWRNFFDLTSGEALENKVIEICDRRFGIGQMVFVIVTPLPQRNGTGNNIDFEMRIFNADGSEAAMCGNATRCVAKFIQSRGLSQENTFFLHY